MAAADIILLVTLWIACTFPAGLCCPELCTCTHKYRRYLAECSNKDLTEVPDGLPPNVTTISLLVNKITYIPVGSFDNVTRVTSLWMARNEIVSIEQGALAPLVHLCNLDISHNKITDFPWEDLQNLTALQMLKMNHNRMVHLPKDAFSNLKDLNSLRLHDNKFVTIAEGTFDGLLSLSHLQIYNNPFLCTCSLDWLRHWILMTTITVHDRNLITCAAPEDLQGLEVEKLPESKCTSPNVIIQTEPNVINSQVYEGSELVLTCEFRGNPKPLVMWNIQNKSQKQEVALAFTENNSAESNEETFTSHNSVQVFNNGTLLISKLSKEHGGNYSCSATNEFGRAEASVSVEVVASPKPTPEKRMTMTPIYARTNPPTRQTTDKAPVFDSGRLPDIRRKYIMSIVPTHPPTEGANSKSYEEASGYPPNPHKCGLTANTQYISSHIFNGSVEDVKQYTYDFGVIALGVSETEATVRLNPLLIPRDKSANRAAATSSESLHADSEERHGLSEKAYSNGLYLCITADHKHSAVQWSRIKEGVNTYLFRDLRPSTNYTLCLTYRGEDCEVQVLFTTRRRVPNLLIIISVSICLLTVSTVPLLGATCFHLVYKYRSKTYKLILKAKDQYHMEKSLGANFSLHAPHTESQRRINGSQLDEEEAELESGDGEKEADTEESVVTESFTLSQCRGNLDDCEVGSEYSDRLPLGAEAVNLTNNYKYLNH